MQQQKLRTKVSQDFISINTGISEYTAVADTEVPDRQNDIQILQKGNTIWARVQARNMSGSRDWSEWLIIAALVLAPPGAFGYTSGECRWVLVASAAGYEVEVMPRGAMSWKMIFDGTFQNDEYFWIPPSGTHHLRIRSHSSDGLVSPWVGIEITVP